MVDYSFLIIGSDDRMKYVYRHLYERGFSVCFADDREYWDYRNIILIAPPKPDYERVRSVLKTGGVHSFFGGSLDDSFYSLCDEENVKVYDYLRSPEVVWENAVLTARGIVDEAKKCPEKFNSGKALVLGFGNCGKAIAGELKKQQVYVAVRRADLRLKIESAGYKYVNLSEISQFLRSGEYSYIYNTIPAMVLDKAAIDSLKKDAVIFDIASAPGGTDFDYCREKGVEAYLRLGIPGKCYPDCAGAIIAGYINRVIFEM
jgi:dipicolinate synthase subunit A